MKYIRMPIEKESPEQFGYEKIKYNLTESSVRDRSLSDLGMKLENITLCYGDHFGIPQLRELIAQDGVGLSKDNVLVTAGASSALFIIATSLLKKGDHIVIAKPNYATNIETPRAIECDISYLNLSFENKFSIDVDELETLIRPNTKYVSLTCPHNPSGVMLDESELHKVIEIVTSKGCYLIIDETYREMTFGSVLPIAASIHPSVISVSSLSKTYGIPGIRIGWLITKNQDLLNLFLCAKEQIGICGSVVDESIALEALSQKKEWILENNKRIQNGFEIVKNWIENEDYFEWIEPQGSCICFPRIKPDVRINIDRFYDCLNNTYGTFVGPGHWFEQSRNHFRIGYAWPTLEELNKGLQGISNAVRET
jgi:aspartate/methionine/tyrosine aminotransferase